MATKVQLAWKTLHGRTMLSGNDYYTQIYRRKPLQTEINNTILWRHIPVNHVLLHLVVLEYLYSGILLYRVLKLIKSIFVYSEIDAISIIQF